MQNRQTQEDIYHFGHILTFTVFKKMSYTSQAKISLNFEPTMKKIPEQASETNKVCREKRKMNRFRKEEDFRIHQTLSKKPGQNLNKKI